MPAHITIWNDDANIIIQRTLLQPDGSVFDLTGYTVTAVVEGLGVADPAGSPFAVTVSDATNGVVQWTIAAADLANGHYRCQFRATNGTIITYSELFRVHVKANL